MDRIDLHVEVVPVSFSELTLERPSERSETIRERVIQARKILEERFKEQPGVYCNAQMSSKMLREVCRMDETGKQLLKAATDRLGLSARAFDRILKVSRTIADLDRSQRIMSQHLAEAIQFRSLDREGWAG